MRISLLCTPATNDTAQWVGEQLSARGHGVDALFPTVPGAASAGAVGHSLADRWSSSPPDLTLALGWEAGLAAQVGARAHDVPVVLRLTRAGRHPGSDRDRLEAALARSSRRVLVPSVGDLDHLVDRGIRRSTLRVLPDAVDRSSYLDAGAEVASSTRHRVAVAVPGDVADLLRGSRAFDVVPMPSGGSDEQQSQTLRSVHAVAVMDDSEAEVALALRAMSCGVPVVAVGRGTLSDIVADEVTGLVVRRPSEVSEALRALLAEPLRRQSMGLAAVDRVRARFDVGVVGAALEGLLVELLPRQVAVAS